MEVDILRDHHIGRVRYPLYTSDMIWYYTSGQRDDEILFFKSYDTKEDVVNCTVQAVFSRSLVVVWIPLIERAGVPHCSFPHRNLGSDIRPRESIEVRALVVTYPRA